MADKPQTFIAVETGPFSGATLLALLVSAHPGIATVGEMNGLIAKENPETYLCSCGRRIRDCAFWAALAAAMGRRGFEFDVARFDLSFIPRMSRVVYYLRLGSLRHARLDSLRDRIIESLPVERRRLTALVARNEAFIESVFETAGGHVFLDTSKDRLRLRTMRRFSTLDVKVIHLVRDVRGVVASLVRRGRDLDAREAARQWVKLHERIEVGLSGLPAATVIRIRYEDVCRDTASTLRRVWEFCGVDPNAGASADLRGSPQHLVGNQMRLNNLLEIRIDERWRSLFTVDQLRQVEAVAGPLSRQFGYA